MYKFSFLLTIYKEVGRGEEMAFVPTGEKLAYDVMTINPKEAEDKNGILELVAENAAKAFTKALHERWGENADY